MLFRSKRFGDSRKCQDTSAYACFKSYLNTVLFGCLIQFFEVFGCRRLVRSNYTFPVFKSLDHPCCGRFDSAYSLYDYVYILILYNFVYIPGGCSVGHVVKFYILLVSDKDFGNVVRYARAFFDEFFVCRAGRRRCRPRV